MQQQTYTHKISWFFQRLLFVLVLLFGAEGVKAVEIEDNIVDENFVVASILVADPGEVLYSTVGHVGIHMQCPDYKLDFVFSYESEDVRNKVLAFLSGKLKMGMFATPYEEYLNIYRTEGRGIKEYTLNLPIEVKRNLWRVLDTHLKEGPNLPYDYIQRGCAHSTLSLLKEGLDTIRLDYGPWPKKYSLTRRELTKMQLRESYPWICFFLNLICNGQIDHQCTNEEKIIMPADLIEVLQHATVNGKPLLAEPGINVLPGIHTHRVTWCTPLLLSVVLLLLTMICVYKKSTFMDYVLLALQTILGLVTVYLTFFSSLCCTEWSWLIIPFNPLPLFLWKWRQRWSLPYAIVIGVWALFMLLWPHMLTDTAFVILSLALVTSYCGIFFKHRNRNEKS